MSRPLCCCRWDGDRLTKACAAHELWRDKTGHSVVVSVPPAPRQDSKRLKAQLDAAVDALQQVAELSSRKQLPLTAEINHIARAALSQMKETQK